MPCLNDLIAPNAIIPALRAANKKQMLMALARRAEPLTGRRSSDILTALVDRERDASTGIGAGIALPHARMADVHKITCIFARLPKPVDFDAPDGQPVDLIFGLITPESAGVEHLQALSLISRAVRCPDFVDRLRAAQGWGGLYDALTGAPRAPASYAVG